MKEGERVSGTCAMCGKEGVVRFCWDGVFRCISCYFGEEYKDQRNKIECPACYKLVDRRLLNIHFLFGADFAHRIWLTEHGLSDRLQKEGYVASEDWSKGRERWASDVVRSMLRDEGLMD
jgi:hypothetical protein